MRVCYGKKALPIFLKKKIPELLKTYVETKVVDYNLFQALLNVIIQKNPKMNNN
jgi:hypothetical protein